MKYVGLWLDHKKAVIVTRTPESEWTDIVHSKLSPLYKARHAARMAPKKRELRREHVIMEFYKEVLKAIKSADKIFLMGPGIAKKEFKTFLKEQGFSEKHLDVITASKMTDRQVAATTRNHFS